MAIESFIHGKHDAGHHEGKRSSLRRLAQSDEEIIDFWKWAWPELWRAALNGELVDERELEPPSAKKRPLDKEP